MGRKKDISRREFLGGATGTILGATGFPYFIPSSALGRNGRAAPSERVVMGLIGHGSRGSGHLSGLVNMSEVQLVGVSDLFAARRQSAEERVARLSAEVRGKAERCETYKDFREMLARKDIEAVVIATPEHWHGLTMIAAVKAGKDVYGEKSLTLTVAEGQALCREVRRYGSVFQVGMQQRSSRNFRFACELVRNGYLGRLHTVRVSVPGGYEVANSPAIDVPAGFDYDMWLGPAPFKPYNAVRCTSPYGWYHIYDYCRGWIQAWGVHYIDTALWGVPRLQTMPLEVEGTAVFPRDGLGDTSLSWDINFTTADGLRLVFTDTGYHEPNDGNCRFEGDKGWVHVNRSGIWAEPQSLLEVKIKANEEHLYESNDHLSNFVECVRSRREPAARVEAGHAATVLGIAADIASRVGRKLRWDWGSESFVNDEQANRMLNRTMRSPWRL